MEKLEVHQPIVTAQVTRNDVVNFQQISLFQVQSTEGTSSLLQLQQVAYFAVHQRMIFQPLHEVGSDYHRRDWSLPLPSHAA